MLQAGTGLSGGQDVCNYVISMAFTQTANLCDLRCCNAAKKKKCLMLQITLKEALHNLPVFSIHAKLFKFFKNVTYSCDVLGDGGIAPFFKPAKRGIN